MANALPITLHAAGVEASDGQGVGVEIGAYRHALKLRLRVTAVTGLCTIYIETSPDNATWVGVGQFDPVSVGAEKVQCFDRCQEYVRARWDVDTDATFSITGNAHTLFAGREDVGQELPASAFGSVAVSDQIDFMIKASCDAEDAISTANPVPLTTWPESLVRRCAAIAAYLTVKKRGFLPEGPDELIKEGHDSAQKWLMSIASGKLKPPGITPTDNLGVKTSSGDPDYPDTYPDKFSNNWGVFG